MHKMLQLITIANWGYKILTICTLDNQLYIQKTNDEFQFSYMYVYVGYITKVTNVFLFIQDGKTPLQLAKGRNQQETVKFLESHLQHVQVTA